MSNATTNIVPIITSFFIFSHHLLIFCIFIKRSSALTDCIVQTPDKTIENVRFLANKTYGTADNSKVEQLPENGTQHINSFLYSLYPQLR
jgi:hypothetical protein